MENYFEKTVVKQKTSKDNVIILLAIVITLLISVGILLIRAISGYFPILYLIFWYGAYRVIVSRNIEYEYSFVDNAFYIDKITNRRWRKRLFNSSLNDFDIFAMKNTKYHEERIGDVQQKIYMTSKENDPDVIFGITYYNNKRTCLYIDADDKMKEYIKKHTDYKFKE